MSAWPLVNLAGNVLMVLVNAAFVPLMPGASVLVPVFFVVLHVGFAAYWVWAIRDDQQSA